MANITVTTYWNMDSRKWTSDLAGTTEETPLTGLVQGDIVKFAIRFVQGGAAVALTAPVFTASGIKALNDFTGSYLIQLAAPVLSDTTLYTFTVTPLNSAQLNTFLQTYRNTWCALEIYDSANGILTTPLELQITPGYSLSGTPTDNAPGVVSVAAGKTVTFPLTLTFPSAAGTNGYHLALLNATTGTTEWVPDATGTGTVTSVAQSFAGGIISVAGSPVTTSGTLALTVAGTSGGIPYFTSASTWASSGALGTGVLTAMQAAPNATGGLVTFGGNVGAATATSINGITITAGTGTLTLASGSIQVSATAPINTNIGGYIKTDGELGGFAGGHINTQGGTTAVGGYIRTHAGVLGTGVGAAGGNINTSNGGGNIDTTAGGSITTGAGSLTGPAGGGTIATNETISGGTLAGSFTTLAASSATTVTSTSASALAVGRLGATTPAFSVDASTASQASGLKVTGAASGAGVTLSTTGGTDETLFIVPKGAGLVQINQSSAKHVFSDVSSTYGAYWALPFATAKSSTNYTFASNGTALYLNAGTSVNLTIADQVRFVATDTALSPVTTNTRALGTSSLRYSTIYGVNGDFSGTLAVTGATTLTGVVTWGTFLVPGATLATNMTTGFFNLPGAAGAPSGVPSNTTGFPAYWDSTNLKLYVYSGGAWKASAAFT